MLYSLVLIIGFVLLANVVLSRVRFGPARTKYDYDVIVVGGSIAGPVVAKALSDQNRKVLLVDRTLFTKPDRIIGELLQPGGIDELEKLGLKGCAMYIGMKCFGYNVLNEKGENVDLKYRDGAVGTSFHFGHFVTNLRRYVWENCKENVTMLEATATDILTEGSGCYERACGIEYTIAKDYQVPDQVFEVDPPKYTGPVEKKVALAPLVLMCDGGMSKWKSKYQHYTPAADYHSNFVALILRDVKLPLEERGTVFLGKTGPILSYRLDPRELRVLVDYNKPRLPSLDMQSKWLIREIAPCMPESMRQEFISVSSNPSNIRSMAVARYPPSFPLIKGYCGLGDHNNQRHPLTGGGMTCAFRDCLRLAENLKKIPHLRSEDPKTMEAIEDKIQAAIVDYSRMRFEGTSCINLLSWALYAVFSDGPLRRACFDYFSVGGECISGPMDLLSGLEADILTLVYHYFHVVFSGMGSVLMKTGSYSDKGNEPRTGGDRLRNAFRVLIDPSRMYLMLYLWVKSILIVLPIVKNEFFSIWRIMDPTCALAHISKLVKTQLYCRAFQGQHRKPVGL
eukprot:gene4203-3035_t